MTRAELSDRWAGELRVARMAMAQHPRHLVLFGLVAGLLLGPVSPAAVLVGAALALLAAGRPGVGLIAAGAVLAGATLAGARLATLERGPLVTMSGRALEESAVVLEPTRERPHGGRSVRLQLLGGPAARAQIVGRIGPGAGWPDRVRVGEIVRVRGTVQPLGRFESHQGRRGALAALQVDAASVTGTRRGGLLGDLDAARQRAERALTRGVPPPEGALLRGMVLGQDEAIEEPVREEFRRSGLAHLLAASGQNVMLLAVLAMAVAGVLGAGLRARLWFAVLLIAIYVPLAGGGPSIQRAGVMGVAGLVAALAGRPAHRWYALGLAAVATLTLNPRAAGEPGWQLSFAAVIALLALRPPLRGWLADRGWPAAVADAVAITVAATIGTAPLMALHFEAVSLASLPANLAAAPAVAPVMWLGMLAATLGQVSSGLAGPLAALATYPAAYVEWVAQVGAGLPAASVGVRLPGPAALSLVYLGLAGSILALRWAWWRVARRPRAERRRLVLACGLVAAVGLVAALGRARPIQRAPGELVVSFLDVGQGDAILLQIDRTAVLFDTGPPEGPVLDRLREAGVDRLDALVVTHQSADHDGMTGAVVRAHRPRTVVNGGAGYSTPVQRALPAQASRAGARVLVPAAGQMLAIGPLELRVLWPPPSLAGAPPGEEDPNDRAMVTHVRLKAFDLLLPADAESNVTGGLDLPAMDALKVAHHGSEDEGLSAQLEQIRPSFAAIEVGAGNSYGHPRPSTLAALRRVPTVTRTDRHGTIRLRVADGRMRVERTRADGAFNDRTRP
jgi:competence protein ComEC